MQSIIGMARQFVSLSCCECRPFVPCVVLCGTDLDRPFAFCLLHCLHFSSLLMTFDRTCGRFIFALVKADNELIFYALKEF